jgi:hypothetical protein
MADFYAGSGLENYLVFPTEIDHHGSAAHGSGNTATEQNFTTLTNLFAQQRNRIISGFTLPTSGGPTGSVVAGTAIIEGYSVSGTGTIAISWAASAATKYVYLKLLKAVGGNVTNPAIEVNETGTLPAYAIPLGILKTNASGVITSVFQANDTSIVQKYTHCSFSFYTGSTYVGSGDWYWDSSVSSPAGTFFSFQTINRGLLIRFDSTFTYGFEVVSLSATTTICLGLGSSWVLFWR